jgi:hypothetical protein
MNMIHGGYTNISYLQYVLTNLLYILKNRIMNFELHHIFHDTNDYANFIVHRVHFTSFNLTMIEFSFHSLDILICNDSLA